MKLISRCPICKGEECVNTVWRRVQCARNFCTGVVRHQCKFLHAWRSIRYLTTKLRYTYIHNYQYCTRTEQCETLHSYLCIGTRVEMLLMYYCRATGLHRDRVDPYQNVVSHCNRGRSRLASRQTANGIHVS